MDPRAQAHGLPGAALTEGIIGIEDDGGLRIRVCRRAGGCLDTQAYPAGGADAPARVRRCGRRPPRRRTPRRRLLHGNSSSRGFVSSIVGREAPSRAGDHVEGRPRRPEPHDHVVPRTHPQVAEMDRDAQPAVAERHDRPGDVGGGLLRRRDELEVLVVRPCLRVADSVLRSSPARRAQTEERGRARGSARASERAAARAGAQPRRTLGPRVTPASRTSPWRCASSARIS